MKKTQKPTNRPEQAVQPDRLRTAQVNRVNAGKPYHSVGTRRKPGLWIALILLLIVIFLLLRPLLSGKPSGTVTPSTDSTTTQTTQQSPGTSDTTTNPTTVTTVTPAPTRALLSAAQRAQSLEAAASEVSSLLAEYNSGRFAVYYQNLIGGETWRYHDTDPFVAASSIKLGINTRLYTFVEEGEISLDEMLAYDSRPYPEGDYESGTGNIQSLPNGSQLTVRETSRRSIRISDNCGTNMIIRRLGGIDAINPWLSEISGAVNYRQSVSYTDYTGQTKNGRHRTCALDLALHAVELYHRWTQNPQIYQPLIDDLCQTTFDFGLDKGIPEEIAVAHKIGTNGIYATENAVGIVLCEEPFVLCVMTEMASAQEARKIQADIAAIFYRHSGNWPWA